ncbi:MAG TPA: hypothetical protein VGO07_02005 [Candidatus Saccharimonadales bacterium]|nr:hypothetical protein [Candidatus Saccharimonadales bacterium]
MLRITTTPKVPGRHTTESLAREKAEALKPPAPEKPKKPNVDIGIARGRRRIAIGLSALALAGTGALATVAVESLNKPEAGSPAPKTPAEQLANPFDQCGIVSAIDKHHKTDKGKDPTTTVTIQVTAPLSSTAVQIYKQNKNNPKLKWAPPVGVGVVLDPQKPSEIVPLGPVADDNHPGDSDVANGIGQFNLYPRTDLAPGTKVGVYILNTVQAEDNGFKWELAGVTPCGELEKGADGWQLYTGDHPPMAPHVESVPLAVVPSTTPTQ